jgi:small multidrug resistance family-3 protein
VWFSDFLVKRKFLLFHCEYIAKDNVYKSLQYCIIRSKSSLWKVGTIIIYTIGLFLLAELAEICGGYLILLWLREGKPFFWRMIRAVALALYGVIATFQTFPSFGRVYAAYSGVFIILSVLWGWGVDKKTPDLYDWLGAAVCLVGVAIMLWAPIQ